MFSKYFIFLFALVAIQASSVWGQSDCRRIFFNTNPSPTLTYYMERGVDVIEDSNGDFLLLGNANVDVGSTYDETDITLTKIDAAGNVLWMKSLDHAPIPFFNPYYPPFNLGYQDYGVRIVQVPNGNGYIVFGGTYVEGFSNLWLFRLTANGDPVWNRMIGEENLGEFPADMVTSGDGNILISGNIEAPQGPHVLSQTMVAKLSPAGTLIWKTGIEVPGSTLRLNAMDELPSGNVVVVGELDFNQSFVAILDADGVLQNSFTYQEAGASTPWTNVLGDVVRGNTGSIMILSRNTLIEASGTGTDQATSYNGVDGFNLIRLANGHIAIAGRVGGGSSAGKGALTVVDANRNFLFGHHYGEVGKRSAFEAICEASNQDLILFGYTNDGVIPVTDEDQFVVRANAAGVSNCCGLGDLTVTQAPLDLVRISIGQSFVYNTTVETDFQAYGVVDPAHGMAPLCTSSKTNPEEALAQELLVFPNPSAGQSAVRLPEDFIQGQLQVTNTLGQVMLTQVISKTEIKLDLSVFKSGMYWVSIRKGDRQLSQRIIIE